MPQLRKGKGKTGGLHRGLNLPRKVAGITFPIVRNKEIVAIGLELGLQEAVKGDFV